MQNIFGDVSTSENENKTRGFEDGYNSKDEACKGRIRVFTSLTEGIAKIE